MSDHEVLIPERPIGVPDGACYFPSAPDFSALEEYVKTKPGGRSLLRVYVPFLFWTFHGVTLRAVHRRALSVNRRTWSMGKCLSWSDESYPVPAVWTWTLGDERASGVRPRDFDRRDPQEVLSAEQDGNRS